MLDDFSDEQVYGIVSAVLIALMTGFAGGYFVGGGDIPRSSAVGGDVNQEEISADVANFLDVITGGQGDITVGEFSQSDIDGLYQVPITVSFQGPQGQNQTQESAVFVSKDGQSIFLQQPSDLQNPPEPTLQPSQ